MDEGIQAGRVPCRTRVYFWVERERCILWMLIKCWTEDSLVMARKTTADGEVETGWLGAWSSVLWPVSQDVCVSSVHYPVSSPKACWTMQWAQRWNLLFFTPLTPNCASHLHDGRWSVEILHATERKTNKPKTCSSESGTGTKQPPAADKTEANTKSHTFFTLS